nr:hypothetical protein [Desulfobacula sp.]
MEKFFLFRGAVFKNTMADGFSVNGQDSQSRGKDSVAPVVGNLKGKPDDVRLIGLKSLVFKGQASGADIQDKDVLPLNGKVNPRPALK